MRFRPVAAAVTVLAVTGAALAVPTPALAAPATLNPARFTLDQDFTAFTPALAALDTALAGRRRSVPQVMDAANRDRTALCNQSTWQALRDRSGADTIGFCWNDGDDATAQWYPQGLTTTREAVDGGHYAGRQLVASAAYHKGTGVTLDGRCPRDPEVPQSARLPIKGVRLSLVDWDADFANTYRHLLLVEPTVDSAGRGTYKPLLSSNGESLHAGGIGWYGQHLYVADTRGGFRVFDFERVYEVSTGLANAVGRQSDGSYHAFDYRYVMPQVGRVRPTGTNDLRFSFLTVDRGPAAANRALVVGEYAEDAATAATASRLVRFPLGADSKLTTGADGRTVTATAAWNTGYRQMQGVAAYNGKYWFGSSNGCRGGTVASHFGTLRHWNSGTGRTASYTWAFGPEDLSYWYDPTEGVADYLWTQTEYANHRVVVAVPQADWD
ncbi:hypothetical protein [Polymorphospora sp. NPDC050346]|uniref:hypothetical protein n=1 Tax=Polymorphospora sp. NPDC050346 TaxID=3155780 RepID=UPI0033CB3B72